MDIPNGPLETFESHGGNIHATITGIITIAPIVLWTRYAHTRLKLTTGTLIAVVLAVIVSNLPASTSKYLIDLFGGQTNLQNILGTIIIPTMSTVEQMHQTRLHHHAQLVAVAVYQYFPVYIGIHPGHDPVGVLVYTG